MRLALRELRRQPTRFAVATLVLAVLAVLLMFIGSLLDGLLASQTGAYRAQRAELIVYSSDARTSVVRSRLTQPVLDAVAAVDGVTAVGGLGSAQLGARRGDQPNSRDLLSVAVLGYQTAPNGLPDTPPAAGEAIADDVLEADGVRRGDVLLVGPARTPVTVVGFVADTGFSGQATLWTSLDTWRSVVAANRPDLTLGEGTVQAAVVTVHGDAGEVARAIDQATDGATETLTRSAAIDAIPGVKQQRSTFNQIMGVTAFIALIVVALFFALITLERVGLYGILKAIGGSTRTLFAGVMAQAVIVALVASAIGVVVTVALGAVIPSGSIPFQVTTSRLLTSVGIVVLAAALGSVFSLRRVLRVDPAEAIGASG